MNFAYYTLYFITTLLFLQKPLYAASSTSRVTSTFYKAEIVKAYPHAREAFTQGLVFRNGFIYEGTGLKGSSRLMKKDLKTGKILKTFKLSADLFGEGITIIGNRIVQLTWKAGKGFVYDLETFEPVREFHYPTEGWGLTNDGNHLIMSDGSSKLFFLNPDTFAITGEIEVTEPDGSPVRNINELEFINGNIYANIWQSEKIAIISPANGLVTGWIDLRGVLAKSLLTYPVDVLNGIAYDSEQDRLFITGKLWPVLFEIRVVRTPET